MRTLPLNNFSTIKHRKKEIYQILIPCNNLLSLRFQAPREQLKHFKCKGYDCGTF